MTKKHSDIPIEQSTPTVEKSTVKTSTVMKVDKKVRFEDEVI